MNIGSNSIVFSQAFTLLLSISISIFTIMMALFNDDQGWVVASLILHIAMAVVNYSLGRINGIRLEDNAFVVEGLYLSKVLTTESFVSVKPTWLSPFIYCLETTNRKDYFQPKGVSIFLGERSTDYARSLSNRIAQKIFID